MLKQFLSGKFALLKSIQQASQYSGLSLFKQLQEIIQLRLGPTHLSPQEYIDLCLYDHQRFNQQQRQTFAGTWLKFKLLASVNDPQWSAIGNDKLMLYSLLKALNLPYPKIYAVACRQQRHVDHAPCFNDTDSLEDFISNKITYPFFAKPIKGWRGVGGFAVNEYNCDNHKLILKNGDTIEIKDFIQQLIDETGYGYLFQSLLHSHPEIARRCGNTVSTCRLVILLYDDGPQLYRTLWKIPSSKNMIDNFQDGKTGNMLAAVNNNDGRVERIINSIGFNQQEVSEHPETKQPLLNFHLPQWSEIKQLCLTAATSLPGVLIQSWDVALTDKGPILIEMNPTGDLHGSQYVDGKGIYDQQMREFIRHYAYPRESMGPLFATDRRRRT